MTYISLLMQALLVAFFGYRTFAHQVLLQSAIMPRVLEGYVVNLKKACGQSRFQIDNVSSFFYFLIK